VVGEEWVLAVVLGLKCWARGRGEVMRRLRGDGGDLRARSRWERGEERGEEDEEKSVWGGDWLG
jgi:hypothetical protein